MRISDWSSDVCSSDLARHGAHEALLLEQRHGLADRRAADAENLGELTLVQPDLVAMAIDVHLRDRPLQRLVSLGAEDGRRIDGFDRELQDRFRSEERSVGTECVRTGRYRG